MPEATGDVWEAIGYNISKLDLQDFSILFNYFLFFLIYKLFKYPALEFFFRNIHCKYDLPVWN